MRSEDNTGSTYTPIKLELPYPKIEVEGPNRVYAQCMLDNMAGVVSEMSASSSYTYQHVMLEDSGYDEISKTLSDISLAEMEHLEMFAEMAKKLTADPRLWSKIGGKTKYWTPRYIQYPKTVKEMLGYSIKSEKDAIKKYRLQAERIKDHYIVELLKRIILDEELHLGILEKLYKEYC